MSDTDIRKQIRGHIQVFGVLTVLTCVSAGSVMIGGVSVYLVLGIAAIQATLVLLFLMHLRAEGRSLRGLLWLCGIFLVALFGLTLLGYNDVIENAEHFEAGAAVAESEPEEH